MATLTVTVTLARNHALAQTAGDVAAQIVAVQGQADQLAEQWARVDDQATDLAERIGAAVERADQAAADHLHFGTDPDGGSAINLYPTVRRIC